MKTILENKKTKRAIVVAYDFLTIVIAWLGAYWLRFNLTTIPHDYFIHALKILPLALCIQIFSFIFFGLYRGLWRFSSMHDLSRIIKSVATGALTLTFILFLFHKSLWVPRSIIPLYALLLIILLGGARFVIRLIRESGGLFLSGQRVLIIGAGAAGESLVRDIQRDIATNYKPVAFLDDRKNKHGHEIHGVRVVGTIDELEKYAGIYKIDLVFIAIPSASSADMRRIILNCEKLTIPFRTLPSLKNIAHGHISMDRLRQVTVEDLLGREPVQLDWEHVNKEIKHKVILVTGAGGSIGSELCRQIAVFQPEQLVILDQCEFNLYQIRTELEEKYPALQFSLYLVDINDAVAIDEIMQRYHFDILFHAAAYKHVPMLEFQTRTAISNNILGTYCLAESALKHHIKKFVLVSTDKAVNPTNVMGATKRAAEILCQYFNGKNTTKFITVRFGNVLGSAGSVVPRFAQQIKEGGPVTVTHPDMTRYFMTIPEATQLILQATSMGKGGEIFVLDMGEPIKIKYLAEQMIILAGLQIGKDIEIKYIGLRPGEKLFEELFYGDEHLAKTTHNKIFRSDNHLSRDAIPKFIEQMKQLCNANDENALRDCLKTFVPDYNPQSHRALHAQMD